MTTFKNRKDVIKNPLWSFPLKKKRKDLATPISYSCMAIIE